MGARRPKGICAVHDAGMEIIAACGLRHCRSPAMAAPPTVVKPAILLRRRFDWMMATSSQMRVLVAKSWVRRP
jgi:hypothetical protein